MEEFNLNEIANKWQKKWEEKKIFYAIPDKKKKKFFVNFPYPYVNGYLHLGHLFSFMRLDIMARYKRMKGYNVLFSQGFHATGQPIIAAVALVKERDKKQLEILKSIGIKDKEIPKFEDPMHWIDFFSKAAKVDLENSGSSIDWRRTFVTTDINPAYDKFIRWQYNKLNEKRYIVKGSHPVVWCPKAKQPIGDHDRKEGEGVTPDEVTLIKFKSNDGRIFPAMTFRPETVYGVTNIWINPQGDYIEVEVSYSKNKENWVVSKEALLSLEMQKFHPKLIKNVKGNELLNLELENPVNKNKVKSFPASFVNTENGTGVVMSVPAHAPLDYLALRDLGENLELIDLIKVDGFKKYPAKEIVEFMKIQNQDDPKAKEATKEIYKKEFNSGILNERLGKRQGKKVSEVKDEMVAEFIKNNIGVKFYTLAETVISRQNAKAVVAIVENQYFLNYSNPEWKKLAHECVSSMRFYPEDTKRNYDYTIDWLKDWACARDKGIGTKLPWDKDWTIEALSDSTIYMAYYTIANYLEKSNKFNFKIEDINDSLFDYVMLGKGKIDVVSKENKVDSKILNSMKEEFDYWYNGGYEFRSSGKDLIQNHMTFSIFHHVAIFPKKNWPSGMAVNGHILLDGEKMSKSKGNFITFRDAIGRFGLDSSRFAMAFASDVTISDANFDSKLADTLNSRFISMIEFAKENYDKGVSEMRNIDIWFNSRIDEIISKSDLLYETSNTKSALQGIYYDLNNDFKWYHRRTKGVYNKVIINRFIEVQNLLLSPAIPHVAEEIWEVIGKKGFVSEASWPELSKIKINPIIQKEHELFLTILSKINKVKEIKNIENLKRIEIIQASNLRFSLFEDLDKILSKTRNFKEIFDEITKKQEYKSEIQFIQKFLPKTLKEGLTTFIGKNNEDNLFKELKSYLEDEFKCEVIILNIENFEGNTNSIPGDPGIIIE